MGILLLGLIGFLGYMGVFNSVQITEQEMGPYTIVYEPFSGDYSLTGPLFTQIFNTLKKEGIQTTTGLGIYYDNPREVPKKKLRSDCGCVIQEKDYKKIQMLTEKNFKIKTIERKLCLVTAFPIKNNLSYMVAPIKGYPAMMKYMTAKNFRMNGLSYEIYDMKAKKIYLVFEASPQ